MTIQRENEDFIKAIFAAVGENKEFSAGDLVDRTAGLRIREPANRDLHVVLVKTFGRVYDRRAIGARMKKLHCQTFGNLCLAQQYSKRLKKWTYTIVTTEYLREWAIVDAGLESDERKRAECIAKLKDTWICHPDDVLRLLNLSLSTPRDNRTPDRELRKSIKRRDIEEREAAAAADRAKVKADPELEATYRGLAPCFARVKPGPGGAPIPDPDYLAPGAFDKMAPTTGPYAVAARDKQLADLVAKRDAEQHPGRPAPGKKMNLWTPEELAAEKRWLQRNNPPVQTPGFNTGEVGGVQWFIHACANRNNRY